MTVTSALGHAFWGRSLFAAEWRNLCFVTYAVDPALLSTRVPAGLSLETFEGCALAVLVFWSARYPTILGLPTPEDSASRELAFRYLVREGERRGYVPLREDSSSTVVALATRSLFREPARHRSITLDEQASDEFFSLEYCAEATAARLYVAAEREAAPPERESLDYLVTQRPFAYTRAKHGDLLRYDLDHPLWRCHAIREQQIAVDFARLYGEEWALLSELVPLNVTVCEGSEVRASLPE